MDLKINDTATEFKNLNISARKNGLKIGVICGGISSEREISLKTGGSIYEALLSNGYNAEFIDFKGDNISVFNKIDVAFLALHGKYGEDGSVQGLLELFKIPYTGSGILASSLAIDKVFSKKIFILDGIPTPEYMNLNFSDKLNLDDIKQDIERFAGYPLVVKPSREGSTIGVTIVENEDELEGSINFAGIYDSKILIERFIKGRQLTVSLIGEKPTALPIVEVKPKSGFYDFKSKYTAGLTEYIVPALLDKDIEIKVKELAIKTHNSLGCFGVSRVDLILDESNKPFILEINTMPGMTATSLVPKAAAAAGISFEKLIEIILNCSSLKM
ncbi:D-alanine--D-alanine ligase [bacterium]|nr:D-alanine--D-alanine ligase [bacterium]